ncbi:MAG: SMC-Scp complex subunit ScpB [Oscillospiraceae bacterium]
MELKELEAAIEGILFAAGEPVGVERLCLTLELDRETVDSVCARLSDRYSYERRGIRLLRLESSYQMASAPEYADYIRKAFESRKPAKLSQPALEVLAIIAYFQPATRAYVDQIRGVDSSYTVGLLTERELIVEAGRLAVPGRPILYRTTKNFLRSFGLSSLEELPELPNGSPEDGQITFEMQANLERMRAEAAAAEAADDFSDEELMAVAEVLAQAEDPGDEERCEAAESEKPIAPAGE